MDVSIIHRTKQQAINDKMKIGHPTQPPLSSRSLNKTGNKGASKTTKSLLLSALTLAGLCALVWSSKHENDQAAITTQLQHPVTTPKTRRRNMAKQRAVVSPEQQQDRVRFMLQGDNWRGAPVGEGEDTIDSYHSYDHRPPANNDGRDLLLHQYTVYPCPDHGIGTMVSGQDPRYYELDPPLNEDFQERNPKFVCDVAKLAESPHQPCVVYSFGSYDEISFEIGMNRVTKEGCDIHIFDPEKPPSNETARRHGFSSHKLGINKADTTTGRKVSTLMKELGHSHIHVLKIDVEGGEEGSVPSLAREGVLEQVDQLSIEFHSVVLMKQGLDILTNAGFGIVYARREDRCGWCTEVSMVKLR